MNQEFRFWREWPTDHRKLFVRTALIGILVTLMAVTALITYPWPSLTWEKSLQDQVLEAPLRRVSTGPYSLELKADSYVVWESWSGSAFQVYRTPYLLFGIFSGIGLILLLSLHSTLRRFYFLAGTGLVLLLTTGLRPEGLFPWMPAWVVTGIIFLIWLIPGLWFQYRAPATSFSTRVLIYSVLTISMTALICLITPVPAPTIYLSTGLLPVTLVLMPVFLILCAHEIPAGLISVIGRAGSGRNGFRDFLILSSIYLINLFAYYLSDLRWLEWSYGIHPVILLVISGVLSVWGIRHQQKQLEGFLDAAPYGVIMMMALGLISASGISFFYLTGNDALFETIRDLSLYAHIGYGVIFVTYVIANFSPLLIKGINVTRVLYQPTVMPFFTYRFGGLVATLAFIFYNVWQRPVNDTIGGYYNALAGYHHLTKDKTLETGYLKLAARYAYHNHQSNVLLAQYALDDGNADKAKSYLQNALERRPTEQTYLSLINLLEINGRSLESFTYLKNGIKKFPESPYLLNALGLTNYGLGSTDSAVWYFRQAAEKGSPAAHSAEINKQAIMTREMTDLKPDSLLQKIDQKNLAALSNVLASASKLNIVLQTAFIEPADSIFNESYAAWLNNWLIQNRNSVAKDQLDKIIPLIDHPKNQDYAEVLNFALAIAAYESGFVNTAIQHLEKAAFYGNDKGRYNNMLSVWMLEMQAPETAVRYNDFAIQQGYKDAALTRAVLLAEAGRIPEAIVAWDSLGRKNEATVKFLADLSKRALGAPVTFFKNLSDEERYAYCRYRLKADETEVFEKLYKDISNDDLRAQTIFDHASKLFNSGKYTEAIRIFGMLEGIPITREDLYHNIQLLELRMLAANGDIELLAKRSIENFTFQPQEQAYRFYFDGLTLLPDTSKAGPAFRWIEKNNLLCEDGILAYASFLNQHKKDDLAAYSLLARALHRNPYSIRLLMAYIRSAAVLGFMDYTKEAVSDLRGRISQEDFSRFIASLPPPIIQP